MTYAPPDLLAVQRYAHDKTGQDWSSLGIIHSTPQGGGYHEGHDLLHAAGTAPEDPGSDYSYTESQRDRNGLTDAASAFDFGNGFGRFYEFNAWIVNKARAGDPRCRDIREIIHTLDGRTVRRFDALGIRSSGDSSHLTHTHFSFFRDSEGRRDRADNFLGLLQEFFDGTNGGTTMAVLEGGQANQLYNTERMLGAIRDDAPVVEGLNNGSALVTIPNKLHQHLVAIDTAIANVANAVAKVQTGGQPTQAQVDSAVLAAMLDPRVQKGIGDAVASHIHVS